VGVEETGPPVCHKGKLVSFLTHLCVSRLKLFSLLENSFFKIFVFDINIRFIFIKVKKGDASIPSTGRSTNNDNQKHVAPTNIFVTL
jgi:hypothetical protein